MLYGGWGFMDNLDAFLPLLSGWWRWLFLRRCWLVGVVFSLTWMLICLCALVDDGVRFVGTPHFDILHPSCEFIIHAPLWNYGRLAYLVRHMGCRIGVHVPRLFRCVFRGNVRNVYRKMFESWIALREITMTCTDTKSHQSPIQWAKGQVTFHHP